MNYKNTQAICINTLPLVTTTITMISNNSNSVITNNNKKKNITITNNDLPLLPKVFIVDWN